jgi:hypothetical protein
MPVWVCAAKSAWNQCTRKGKIMIDKATFSKPALERLTPKQKESLLSLMSRFDGAEALIFSDFTLPAGYLGFMLDTVAGGISPDGRVSK